MYFVITLEGWASFMTVGRSGACCLPLPGAGVGGLWLLEPLKSMPVDLVGNRKISYFSGFVVVYW